MADSDTNGSGDGGGIAHDGGTVTISNTILGGNADRGGQAPDCSGTVTSGGSNIVQSTTGCTFAPGAGDLVGVDPRLGPVADNGGTTQTHGLLKGSPAVNAGGPGCTTADQRGLPRTDCDIGAVELVLCQRVAVNRFGGTGNDRIAGTPGADGILGFGGKDRLSGKGGKDGLCGGPGKDTLKGGGGKDRLDGGPGKDLCSGGPGRDKAKSCEREKQIP